MNRKSFLKTILAVLIAMAVLFLIGCESTNTNEGNLEIIADSGVLVEKEVSEDTSTYSFQLADKIIELKSSEIYDLDLDNEYIIAYDLEKNELYSAKQVMSVDNSNEENAAVIIEAVDSDEVMDESLNEIDTFPIELDGEEAQVVLMSSAFLNDGEFLEDDGNQWRLFVNQGDKSYPLLDYYISFGGLGFHVYESEGNIHIVSFSDSTAGMEIWDFTYNDGNFEGNLKYTTGNVNLLK